MKASLTMRRFSYQIALLLLTVLIASGCAVGPSALSQAQLQEFVQKYNIQPLAVENVGGDVTVILYKDAKEMGCHIAFARQGIEDLHSRSFLLNLRGDAITPVSFTYDAILKYDISA